MHNESKQHLETLRARVAQERNMLKDLQKEFTHASMKGWAERALLDLDDVEAFFLSRLDKQSRTASEEIALIRSAYMPLNWAVDRRKKLQDALSTYGAGAMLIPNPYENFEPRT